MQRIFSAIGQIFHKSVLILSMLCLLTFSSLFIFVQQPSLAAVSTEGQKLIQQEKKDKESETANLRNQEYEEQLKAEKNPDKVYEENLKEERQANPGPGLVDKAVEGAGKLVDKVTGKE